MRAVVAALRQGEVVSYGEVAARAGRPGAARAAGSVMARRGSGTPWWRIVRADGRLAAGDVADQARRLAAEGVEVRDGRVADPRLRARLSSGGAGVPANVERTARSRTRPATRSQINSRPASRS